MWKGLDLRGKDSGHADGTGETPDSETHRYSRALAIQLWEEGLGHQGGLGDV